eukprot:s2789_g7.t1
MFSGTDFGFSPPGEDRGRLLPNAGHCGSEPTVEPARLCQRWCSSASGGEQLLPGLASTFVARPRDPLGSWHLCHHVRADFCEGCFGWSLLATVEGSPSRDGTEDFATTSARPENFSTFCWVYNPQTCRELLMTRQVGGYFVSGQGTPAAVDQLGTFFGSVPRTLNADEMRTFMVWVSFPSELLVPRLQNTLHGQAFVLQGSDCTWGSNGFLFSFSPRSALLMLLFGLSIRRRQGLPDFVHTAMVTTLGMRLSWGRWKELLQNANVWNRRYVDFFVAMAGTLTLSRQQDAGALQSMVTLVRPIAPYVGVDSTLCCRIPTVAVIDFFIFPYRRTFGARC